MRDFSIRKIFLSLFVTTLLVSCAGVEIKNTRAVTVAGRLLNGADWANMLDEETGSMTFEEFVEFLEPQPAERNSRGEITRPERGGAICQSADHFNQNKTSLELACIHLGKLCTYEMQEAINAVGSRTTKLIKSAAEKR